MASSHDRSAGDKRLDPTGADSPARGVRATPGDVGTDPSGGALLGRSGLADQRVGSAGVSAGEYPEGRSLGGWLDACDSFLERHVCFDAATPEFAHARRDACVLWIAHTYCADAFEVSPRLAITSPVKGSGKSTLLSCIAILVFDALVWVQPSDAVVYRARRSAMVTLLLDEIDTIFGAGGRARGALRSVLNEGYRRGATVPRVGKDGEVEHFPVFGPVAFAGIGSALHPTLQSRSLPIEIWKPSRDRLLVPLDVPSNRRDAEAEAQEIHAGLRDSVFAQSAEIAGRVIDPPEELDDRSAELWRPLLAIAQHATGTWPSRARRAALALSTALDEDPALFVLRAIRRLFADTGLDRLSTTAILGALEEVDDAPWHNTGRPLDARHLARLLRPFHITRRTLRFPNGTQAKGYQRCDFEQAWSRYLTPEPVPAVPTVP